MCKMHKLKFLDNNTGENLNVFEFSDDFLK